MTPPLALALCGCGVMGHRHLLGLRKLRQVGRPCFALTAVVDPVPASAAAAADLAADLLGRRPATFATLADLRRATSVDAVAITTAPDSHADLALDAVAAGCHVLVEKPIALTVRQALRMVEAAAAADRRLAVAENYRRDPINRLARALLDAGAVGRPFLAIQSSSGFGGNVVITPWRHRKASGGIVVDMGVHYADILEYLLGPAVAVAGMAAVVDDHRQDAQGTWHPADAEDLTLGLLRFASGALASLVLSLAGRGADHFRREIFGTAGSLAIPLDRTGHPPTLTLLSNGSPRPIPAADLLPLVPDFALDPTTASLFGADRLASYDIPFADVDANLLAIEHDDFASAILDGREPEVAGRDGLRSLALTYGLLEAARAARTLPVADLISGAVASYQDELEPPG